MVHLMGIGTGVNHIDLSDSNDCSSDIISTTLVLRISLTFSLKVTPMMSTLILVHAILRYDHLNYLLSHIAAHGVVY